MQRVIVRPLPDSLHLCRPAIAALVLVVSFSLPAAAQDEPPRPEQPAEPVQPHRIGPLSVSPTVTLQDIGVDSNVYNVVDPTSDFTFTVVPVVQANGRVLRLDTTLRSSTDLVYFARQTSERSVNQSFGATVRAPLARVTITGIGNYLNTRERPTEEIDARSRHLEYSGNAGIGIRLTGKVSASANAQYVRTAFDGDAVFDHALLAEELNRRARTVTGSLRYQATRLTAVGVSTGVTRTRFGESHVRDSDAKQVMVGVDLQPRALIAGNLTVGYQQFNPLSRRLQPFSGAVGSADLTYRLVRTTFLGVSGGRSIEYSYSEDLPYYLRQGYGLSVRHYLLSRWDVRLSGSRFEHRYRRATTQQDTGNAIDRLSDVSIVTGYQGGPAMRLTVGITYRDRRSSFELRGYDSFRVGTSVTYAF